MSLDESHLEKVIDLSTLLVFNQETEHLVHAFSRTEKALLSLVKSVLPEVVFEKGNKVV